MGTTPATDRIGHRWVLAGVLLSWIVGVACLVSEEPLCSEGSRGGYLCAGDGFYLSGQQNGQFAPHGWHIHGAMGGLWTPTTRLLSGYTFQTLENSPHPAHTAKFEQFVWGNRIHDNQIIRSEMVVDGLGLVVHVENISSEPLSLVGTLFPHLRGPWLAEEQGWTDGPDYCWLERANRFLCAGTSHNNQTNAFLAVEIQSPIIASSIGNSRLQKNEPFDELLISDSHALDTTLGSDNRLRFMTSIPDGCSLYITGSTTSLESTVTMLESLSSRSFHDWREWKRHKLSSLLQSPVVSFPQDEDLQNMFEWARVDLSWLYHSIGDLGQGVMGGLPEYPMIYGCDTTYTIEGMLHLGLHQEASASLDNLMQISLKHHKGSGQIIHEATPLGTVYHPGNIQETAHYLMQVGNVYKHTGNTTWLLSHYEALRRGVQFLRQRDSDNNFIPEGTGIMEIGSFYVPTIEMIDVAVYTLQAYRTVSKLYEELAFYVEHEFMLSESLSFNEEEQYRNRIDCNQHSEADCLSAHCAWGPISSVDYTRYHLPGNTPWCFIHHPKWSDLDAHSLRRSADELSLWANSLEDFLLQEAWLASEGSFAEFFATPIQVVPIIQEALDRLRSLPSRDVMTRRLTQLLHDVHQKIETRDPDLNRKQGWNVYQSWITSIPLEQGLFPEQIARHSLNTARQFATKYGVYVTGIDKPDRFYNPTERVQGLYTNAVMTLPTGVQAVAEARYGRMEGMFSYLKMLQNSFSYETPGSLHELSPAGGCFAQAWSIYSVAVPLFEGVFGMHLDRLDGKLTVTFTSSPMNHWENWSMSRYPLVVGRDLHRVEISLACESTKLREQCSVTLELKSCSDSWIGDNLALQFRWRGEAQQIPLTISTASSSRNQLHWALTRDLIPPPTLFQLKEIV